MLLFGTARWLFSFVFLTIGSGTTTRTGRPRWRRSASTRPSRGGSESEAEYEEMQGNLRNVLRIHISFIILLEIQSRYVFQDVQKMIEQLSLQLGLERTLKINVLVKTGGRKFCRFLKRKGFLIWLDKIIKKVTHSSTCRTYCTFFKKNTHDSNLENLLMKTKECAVRFETYEKECNKLLCIFRGT